jgi:hypothetical protein
MRSTRATGTRSRWDEDIMNPLFEPNAVSKTTGAAEAVLMAETSR